MPLRLIFLSICLLLSGCVSFRRTVITPGPGQKPVPVLHAVTMWGYVDAQGGLIIRSAYDEAGPFRDGLARVKREGKYGFINKEGRWIVPAQFAGAADFSEGLAAVQPQKGGLWGFINSSGTLVISARFDSVGPFSEGMAVFSRRHRYGYIDRTGEWIINPQYDAAGPFHEGLAAIQNSERWSYIDPAGKIVIGFPFKAARPFYEERAAVIDGDLHVYIDKTGARRISPEATQIEDFSQGLARVFKYGAWFFVNPDGEYPIRDAYRIAGPFAEGLAPVAPETSAHPPTPNSPGLRPFRTEDPPNAAPSPDRIPKWGYIDLRGKVVIPVRFEEAAPFSNGRARVRLGGKYGFIDNSGTLKVPATYEDAQSFSEGRAAVMYTEMREHE
jgi:hypothetical protein